MFDKVLIANRGEIALRVARACRELGIRTVAVYSTQDRDSAVVSYADEAVHIGPGPARHSYLYVPALVEAARQTHASAVHPGYGFLSEDSDFAEVCADNGLVFIGPPAPVIARLGDKAVARRLMADAGLPVLPGSSAPLASSDELYDLVDRIGLPVMIKAVAGGGGRGMAVVTTPSEILPAFTLLSGEAQALFGDSRLYAERYLPSARHVEVQILCDAHGNGLHLGVRDCSVQRRHQKLLEESPAPALAPEVAAEMGARSVAGALAAGFVGAGTFEFVVDAQSNYYFMEVNCRIQVEHPVTELVTGIDLVQEQLRIAAGGRLGFEQADVVHRGVALECRINVEDPDRSFAPTPGRIESFVLPGGPFVRVDTHGYPGYRMPAIYDSLLAKVLAWAPTRDQALSRMERALGEFRATGPGIRTTAGFLRQVLADPGFRSGSYDTGLVDRMLTEGRAPADAPAHALDDGAPAA